MDDRAQPAGPPPETPLSAASAGAVSVSLGNSVWANLRRRVLAGIFVIAPFLVTLWIVFWLYTSLEVYLIAPAAKLIVRLVAGGAAPAALPPWFVDYVAPLLGVSTVALLLYFLGFFAQTRAVRLLDAALLRIPILTSIHKAVSRVFQALSGQGQLHRFQRAVLVPFPHPGMRVAGFVTSSCRDEATGKTILCVFVPTTPVPSSGYVLLMPEDQVTDLNWGLEETVQTVVSFGITAPPHVRYFPLTDGGPVR